MGKIAFMYPGQGSQKAGMGQNFYEKSEKAKMVFDLADQILGYSLSDVCFTDNSLLDRTKYAQPALVTTCLAITEELKACDIFPDVTAGFSLGEYTAIAVAGGFSNETAIRAVDARGTYMGEACSDVTGAMYAVAGMSIEKMQSSIRNIKNVFISNYNCPEQAVISGEKMYVEMAARILKNEGAEKCIPLNVSGAFHSPFMQKAENRMQSYLEQIEINDLKIPYITNVTAEYVYDKNLVKNFLKKQICSPVLFELCIRKMLADGVDIFVEIGPGKTLTRFINKIDNNVMTINVANMEDMKQLKYIKRF